MNRLAIIAAAARAVQARRADKQPTGRPSWAGWNPGALRRSDTRVRAEHQYNPRTRKMERVR